MSNRPNPEQTRAEIRRMLARTRGMMLKQTRRMRALDEGRPDPHPELDEEFMDSMIREHSGERDGTR